MQLIEKDNKYYFEKKGKLEKAAIFTDHYYALKPYKGIALLEIDGIRMHLIKDFATPLDYAKEIMKTVIIKPKDRVYDTCSGLGYWAIEEAKYAKEVISTELKKEILELGKLNPSSESFFNNPKIKIINKSCELQIKKFKDNEFDIIMHDPPSFAIAGELYSLEFYKQCFRVLGHTGQMFHYIGAIGKNKGRMFNLEIESRLKLAGFKKCKYLEKLQGILTEK